MPAAEAVGVVGLVFELVVVRVVDVDGQLPLEGTVTGGIV